MSDYQDNSARYMVESGSSQPEVEAQTGLSDREKEVLLLAADGFTDKQIALKLDIGPKTVRTYWDRMRQKLQAASRTQVLAKALRISYDCLAESEERWRRLLEQMPVLFIAFDFEGCVVYLNEEARRVSGYSTEATEGQNLFDKMFPDCQEQGPECFSKQDFKGQVERLVCADGSVRDLIWYSAAAHVPIQGWASWIVGIEPEHAVAHGHSVERAVRLL